MLEDKKAFHSVFLDLIKSKYDSNNTKTEKYAAQLHSIHSDFVKRNSKLTDLLEDYIKQRKERVETNNKFKNIIFWFFILLLVVLTITFVWFLVSNRDISNVPGMVSVLSVVATYVGSLIAVFEIVTKYLFPADEEKDAINMIQAVIKNDIQVENLTSKAIDKIQSIDIQNIKTFKELYDKEIITKKEFEELKKSAIERIKNK